MKAFCSTKQYLLNNKTNTKTLEIESYQSNNAIKLYYLMTYLVANSLGATSQ